VQTTLLGLAVAIILALVAALIGPLVIDWGHFRPLIEAESSRLLGTPIRVAGAIEGALLPNPSLTLHDIEIGPAGDSNRLNARTLSVEFSLGPLMRGEWHIADMHLVGPEFNIGFDSAGHLTKPKLAVGFDADAVSIDHLNIEDGHAVLRDVRNGSRQVLEKLWFNGEVRSLAGPFKGDGAFVAGGELYPYRVSAGRAGDDGAMKLRLNIDPIDRPLALEAEGTLALDRGEPRFEGSFTMSRPAGLALASGGTLAGDPWRLGAKVKATSAAMLLEQMEFQYGPEERAIKLNGTAELKFGGKPRFDGVLSARDADFDRAFASPEVTQRRPLAALKVLSEAMSGAWRPSIPARLGIGIDTLTLGGATVQTLRGDLTTDGDVWNLEGFELRAPGATQVKLSGRLDVAAKGLGFVGPVDVDSANPSLLVSWLEGSTEPPANRMKPLRARGEITLGGDTIAIDRLKAEFDRKTIEGRLSYAWAAGDTPARLNAELKAPELDIDALVAFANAARDGTAFEMPRDITLGVDVGRATIAGIEARQVSARLRRDSQGLQVDRLAVADLGGTAFEASGQIDTSLPSPRGKINLSVDARTLGGVIAVVNKVAPDSADAFRRMAERLPATKANATLSLDGVGTRTTAKLTVDGRSGPVRLSLAGEATRDSADVVAHDLRAFTMADMHLEGKLDAEDGGALVAVLGLDKVIAVDKRPGQLNVTLNGPLGGELELTGRVAAGGLDATAKGNLKFGERGPTGDVRLTLASADLRPLRHGASMEPLPAALTGNLTATRGTVALDDFAGTVAGVGLRGHLGFAFADTTRIEGRIEADSLDAAAMIATAIGVPAQPAGAAWSVEPFGPGFFDTIDGRVEFAAGRATINPTLVVRQAKGVAKFGRTQIALTDFEGNLADGRLFGQLTFNRSATGVSAAGHLGLAAADAAALLRGNPQPPVTGRFGLQMDLEAEGRSAAALIGSLTGLGAVSLEGAQLAGLDPKAFELAERAVDRGLVLEPAKIADVVGPALDAGGLSVASLEGVVTVTAGQLRLTNAVTRADGADLTMTGNIDLAEGLLNARLTLMGPAGAATSALERPAILVTLKGPASAPKRTLDLSTLTAWLTLHSVEQQSKRLEAIEAARPALGETPAAPAKHTALPLGPDAAQAPAAPTAPPLPAPIDIRPAAGSAAHHVSTQANGGTTTPVVRKRTPAPAKPPLPITPPAFRPPIDLPVGPQN
jgi:large subunit ribosomal protein L24